MQRVDVGQHVWIYSRPQRRTYLFKYTVICFFSIKSIFDYYVNYGWHYYYYYSELSAVFQSDTLEYELYTFKPLLLHSIQELHNEITN